MLKESRAFSGFFGKRYPKGKRFYGSMEGGGGLDVRDKIGEG